MDYEDMAPSVLFDSYDSRQTLFKERLLKILGIPQ